MSRKTLVRLGLGVLSLTLVTSLATAQLKSDVPGTVGPHTIALTATLSESLTVGLSGTSVNWPALIAGNATNAGSTSITATTSWVLNKSRSSVEVDAFFLNAAAALTDGSGNNIPSSAFTINDSTGGATSGALTNNTALGPAGAGLAMENIAITNSNRHSSVADVMSFNIDLSSVAMQQLPAGSYSGTLNIQAQAN